MNRGNVIELETPATREETSIHLPLGLLGFERIKQYALICDPDDDPFSWLEAGGDASLAFLVLSPFQVMADYEMDLNDEDAEFLKLNSPRDAVVLNIVTLQPNGRATINLKGPIVLNKNTMIGKQVVLANAASYSLQHPLPVAD
jgi:flagellar assembly factor FliW